MLPPALQGRLAAVVLQQDGDIDWVPDFLEDTVAEFVAFLPRLIGAIIILLIGWIIGAIVGSLVKRIFDGLDFDRRVQGTPLGRMMGDREDPVATLLGKLSAWFIYALAILTAADALDIPLLSEWIQRAVSYLPAFVAGLVIIIGGFIVSDFVADAINRTRAAAETQYAGWFATGVRFFLYFTVIVIGLDTMGVDVGILFVFARALAWGLAAAVAIGFGIAIGWGGKDYVRENIDRWAGRANAGTPSPAGGGPSGGGASGSSRSSPGSTDRDVTEDSGDRDDRGGPGDTQ